MNEKTPEKKKENDFTGGCRKVVGVEEVGMVGLQPLNKPQLVLN